MEILDASLTRNTMVCLGTGTGKTFIAVMLINELAHQIRAPYDQDGRRTVFLVNTGASTPTGCPQNCCALVCMIISVSPRGKFCFVLKHCAFMYMYWQLRHEQLGGLWLAYL